MRFLNLIFRAILGLLLVLGFVCSMEAQAARFAQPTVLPTGNWPSAIYTVDINGDSYPDLIYIDGGAAPGVSSVTHVLLNDGKGNFHQSAQLNTVGDSLALAFLTGTGNRDLGWLVFTQNAASGSALNGTVTLSVAPGLGDGTFGPTQSYTFATTVGQPSRFAYLTAATLHAVSPQDVLAVDTANNLLYAFRAPSGKTGTSDYTFATLPDGAGPIAIRNLNGDAKIDLIVNSVASADAQVFLLDPLLAGLGKSPVSPSSIFHGAGAIHSLLVEDVNLDGRPDLIAEGANGRIDVFPGNGDGTFSSTSIGGTGALDGLSGNGGHLIALTQLASGQPDAFTATAAGVSSLLGQGTAYFGLKGIYNAGPGRTAYATADFNGDGILDLAVDSPEGIAILYGNADGSFQTSQAFATGQPALAGAVGAFTASGHQDVAVSTSAIQAQLLLGAGDGTFAALPAPSTTQAGAAGQWSGILAGDLNGDGKLDLVQTADGANAALPANGMGLTVQLGHGDGTFDPPAAIFVANQFYQPEPSSCQPPFDHFPGRLYGTSVLADFNADGLPDIANRDSGAYRILRGNNGSATASYSQYPTLFFAGADGSPTASDCNLNAHQLIATGDFNGDGRPDLVFQNNGSLLVSLADSTGTPQPTGDLAVDGSLTTPGQLTAPVLAANFGGTSPTLGYPAAIGSMIVADLDGDGNQDLLVLYHNLAEDPANPGPQTASRNWLYVWYGSGNGQFLTSTAHPQNPVRLQPSRDFYEMAVGKLDSSGKPLLAMSDGFVLSVGTLGAEQHLLAGQGINSLTVADLRGTGQQDLVVANGGLTLSNPVANHETLTPNPDVNTGGVTVLLNAAAAPAASVTGSLTAAPEPSYAGNDYTLTLTLTPSAGSPVPTGSVQFYVNGTALGTPVALVAAGNGTATASTLDQGGRLPGSYSLTATYAGDSTYAAPPAFTDVHTVVLSPTVTTLTPTTPLTVFYGQGIDGTFSVTGMSVNHPPGGLYTVEDNGVATSNCTAIPILTACPYGNPQLLDAGPHTLVIHYLGDAYNAPSYSAPVAYTILPDVTTLSLTSSLNPSIFGQTVTFTAVASANISFVPSAAAATTDIYDGSTLIASGQNFLTSNQQIFTTSSLAVGTHTLSFYYHGTRDYLPATSNVVVQVVQPAPATPLASATTIASSLNPSAPGQSVTLTAAVSVPGPFAYVPGGTVTFLIDGQGSGAPVATDVNGLARMSLPVLASGTHTVVASYSGAAGTGIPPKPGVAVAQPAILPSQSATLVQVITYPLITGKPGFLLEVTPASATVVTGQVAYLVVKVTDVGGFNQPVALTCSGLPNEAGCVFLPALVPAGGGSVPLQISASAPYNCGDPAHPYSASLDWRPAGRMPLLSCAALLGLACWRRRSKRLRKLLQGLALGFLLGGLMLNLGGCGRCTDLGTRPGTYTFTLTGTAQGSPISQTNSQTIRLTVTDK